MVYTVVSVAGEFSEKRIGTRGVERQGGRTADSKQRACERRNEETARARTSKNERRARAAERERERPSKGACCAGVHRSPVAWGSGGGLAPSRNRREAPRFPASSSSRNGG